MAADQSEPDGGAKDAPSSAPVGAVSSASGVSGAGGGQSQSEKTPPPRCRVCLERTTRDPPPGAPDVPASSAAAGESSSAGTGESSSAVRVAIATGKVCEGCASRMSIIRERVEVAMHSRDAFPTSSSAPQSKSPGDAPEAPSILRTARTAQEERRKLNAVRADKLPRELVPVPKNYEGRGEREERAPVTARVADAAPRISEALSIAEINIKDGKKDKKRANPQQGQAGKTVKRGKTAAAVTTAAAATNAAASDPKAVIPGAEVVRERGKSPDLMGAIVRIKKGKFAGFTGKIVERQDIRRLMIDSAPSAAFDVKDVEIIEYAPGASARSDVAARYQGARVGVVNKDNQHYGVRGRVLRVIVGNWFITDNPAIANAFQAHKFEVLKYADPGEAAGGGRDAKSTGGVIDLAGDDSDDEDEERQAGNVDANRGTVVQKASSISTEDASSNTSAQPKQTKAEAGDGGERSLMGATVLIKKGRFKGRRVVIQEKQSIERLQLDGIPAPLGFGDVQILRYAEGANLKDRHQRYMGAKVRVLNPPDYAGMEPTVARVIVSGDWYIVDDPDITTAFPAHKFEVVRYADDKAEKNGEVIDLVDGDGDGNKEKRKEGGDGTEKVVNDAEVDATSKDGGTTGDNPRQAARDRSQSIATNEGDGIRAQPPGPPSLSDSRHSNAGNTNGVRESLVRGSPEEGRKAKRPLTTSIDDSKSAVGNAAIRREGLATRDNTNGVAKNNGGPQINSVTLPTPENIEMASRLSAFDSYMFLADGRPANDNVAQSSSRNALVEQNGPGSSAPIREDGANATQSTGFDIAKLLSQPVRDNRELISLIDDAIAAEISKVISRLIERKKEQRDWPAVKVVPGTEVTMERGQGQQPVRVVPMEERIVRTVPGSSEERREMSNRLGAFDDYMFLADKTR